MFTFFYYLVGVIQRFRQVAKQLTHFLLCFEIELIVEKRKSSTFHAYVIIRKFFSSWRALFFTGVDAQQNIVCVGVFLIYIMRIIGANSFDVILFREFEQNFVYLLLLFHAVALQLDVKIFAKQI